MTPIQLEDPSNCQRALNDSSFQSNLSPLSLAAASFSALYFMPGYTYSTTTNTEYEHDAYEGIRHDAVLHNAQLEPASSQIPTAYEDYLSVFGESPAGTSTAGYPDAPIDYLQVGAGVHASGSFCPKCRDETDGDGSCSPASPSLCDHTHASTTPIDTPLFTPLFEDMTDFNDMLQLFGGTSSIALHAAPDPILPLADISTTPIDKPLFTPLFEDMADFDDALQLFGGTDSVAQHAAPDSILSPADISTPIDTPLFTPPFGDMADFDDALQLFGGTESLAQHATPNPISPVVDNALQLIAGTESLTQHTVPDPIPPLAGQTGEFAPSPQVVDPVVHTSNHVAPPSPPARSTIPAVPRKQAKQVTVLSKISSMLPPRIIVRDGEQGPDPYLQPMEHQKWLRKLASRRTRQRKADCRKHFEDEVNALKAEVAKWRERALMAQDLLGGGDIFGER